MPTINEYSILASNVYAPTPTVLTDNNKVVWTMDPNFRINRYGFSCALYKTGDIKKQVAVLAYRGSEGLENWLVEDVAIATYGLPPHAIDAVSVAKSAKLQYPNLALTGHSLGGALAIIAGAHTGLKVVTFNAPGILNGCIQSSYLELFSGKGRLQGLISTLKICVAGSNIENVRTTYDVVSSPFLRQVGTTNSIPDTCRFSDVMCNHSMQSVVDSLNKANSAVVSP